VKNWSRVLSYFRPEMPAVWLALLLMGLSIGANLLKPWPVALILDHIVGGKEAPGWLPKGLTGAEVPTLLGLAALAIFVLHSAQGIFSAGQNYFSIKAGLRGLARMRNELFFWMQRLSVAFYQRRNQGDLIYRASWDTYSIQTIFQHGLFKFLGSFATILLMVVVMWRVNVVLTLITLAVFPPLLLAMYFFGRRMNQRSLAAHQADSKVTSLVQQNISSLPVIQSFTREGKEQEVFGAQVTNSLLARLAQHRLEVTYWLVIAVLFGIGTAGLTWWGAREILRGTLTVGELVIFLSYLGQLYEPLNQLSHVGATVSDANAGTQRIFEVLDAKEEVVESPGARKFPPARGSGKGRAIEFEGISFGYEPEKPVLKGVTFHVQAGEVIGLVGASGSGKTTLLNLLPRFYDPESGKIAIEGVELREIGLKDLREHVAYVFQETFLLPGTVAENIALGHPDATVREIQEAARLANAHDFITKLPQGYETVVGEGATRLSVGEKQRIGIARAFLKNAPILLLDEPTSSLDAETEAVVVESLRRLAENRTTLMAAHRVTTLANADKILVLENGVLTEFAAPQDLLRRDGYFARAMQQNRSSV
jgi:ATP-binding cassette subfamily B protein/subfamily B ATP-binding cassette protein MsbA